MIQTIGTILFDKKGPRPEGATSVYKVSWGLFYETNNYAVAGNHRTPQILPNHKFFASKEKADALKRDIDEAFKTLGYMVNGFCYIEEDWYE